MYVGLKQPRGDGERYVTPARAAAKETRGEAYSPEFWIGVCREASWTLTLFKDKESEN